MSKNIIFCFTGTGNSLRIAKDISKIFENTSICSMKNANNKIESNQDSIGFFFPVYFGGLPMQVKRFISSLNLQSGKLAYIYAITTFANFAGNPFAELNDILTSQGIYLNYANKVKMPNSVPYMNQKIKINDYENRYQLKKTEIIRDLNNKIKMKFNPENAIYKMYNRYNISKLHANDNNFSISNDCNHCSLCQKLCPVNNIEISGGKPSFCNHCEQCMACIQMCPKKAINYGNKTLNRPRYSNSHITIKELLDLNNTKLYENPFL